MSCHKGNLYINYIPSISEKENDNSIIKSYQKSKTENKINEPLYGNYMLKTPRIFTKTHEYFQHKETEAQRRKN